MKTKNWKLKEKPDLTNILALSDSLNISTILSQLLIQRNVTNFFEAKAYFRPSLDTLLDPLLMSDMEKAANRIIKALTENEIITIYGDYDVDGTCSATLMYLFLKELGANVNVYIPNRINDGYGLSLEGIDIIKERGSKLIVTVDCGITAVEEIEYANQLGLDVIVTDHHKPKEELPKAFAVLDPLKPDCDYPFKSLCGAGVAFKLARAICDRFGQKDLALKYLDLVALASAADIVSLTGENRVLVRKGIETINENPRPGIKALIKIAKMEPGNLSSGQIVFTIAPRINAVGRLGDAYRAVDLFCASSEAEADELAKILEEENNERRKIDEATFSYALEKANETIDFDNTLGIVLHDNNWHLGVIGIVASRLVEKFHKPSIMLTTIDGVAKGSARSVQGFNIYAALKECEDLLIQYGGHEAAAGIAIEIEKIPEFKKRFNEILKTMMKEKDITQEISIDAKINFSEITPKFLRILEQFAPFGPGNLRPVFLAEDVTFEYPPKIVGKNHLITAVKQKDNEKVFDAIGFNLGGFVSKIDKDKNIMDIVFSIENVTRDGRTYPQIRLKDIKIKEY